MKKRVQALSYNVRQIQYWSNVSHNNKGFVQAFQLIYHTFLETFEIDPHLVPPKLVRENKYYLFLHVTIGKERSL